MKREDIKNKIENYKNEGFQNGMEKLKEKKGKIKKIAILTLTGSIVLGGIGAGTAFAYVKSNTKYSQNQLQDIALSKIPGEVVGVKKDVDEDNMSLSYEFKIKDKNNMLNEIELDSKTGAIIDIENYNEHKDNDHEDKKHDEYNSSDKNYNYEDIKANVKYSQEEAKKVALDKVPGEVIKVEEDIDTDNNSLVYEFKIKTNDNKIKEVEVDSKMGNIVDIDSHDDESSNLDYQDNKVDSNSKNSNQ